MSYQLPLILILQGTEITDNILITKEADLSSALLEKMTLPWSNPKP
jgi:hypothetical protein